MRHQSETRENRPITPQRLPHTFISFVSFVTHAQVGSDWSFLSQYIRSLRLCETQDEFATRGTGPSPVPRHCCFSSFDSVSERAPRRPDTPCVCLTLLKKVI